MPGRRHPHATDGRGIGKKLKGDALRQRLDGLATTIRVEAAAASTCGVKKLEHAKAAGDALLEANRRLGKRRKWTMWLHENVSLSQRTREDYMRVARCWDHPNILAAHVRGEQIDSISGFLRLLSPPCSTEATESRARYADAMRDMRTRLREMNADELRMLALIADTVWERIRASVRDGLAEIYDAADYESDPWRWYVEKRMSWEEKRAVRSAGRLILGAPTPPGTSAPPTTAVPPKSHQKTTK